MGSGPRPGRPRSAEVDAAILDATIDEFVDRGYAKLTIDGIASRAGVARTTVYRRWPTLDRLCLEALERVRQGLPPVPGDDVREDLVFALTEFNRILNATRFGQILPQLAAESRLHPELAKVYWTTYLQRRDGVIAGILRRGMAEGLVRGDLDIELGIDMFTAPLIHRSLWQLDKIADEQIAVLVDTLLAGLRPAQSR